MDWTVSSVKVINDNAYALKLPTSMAKMHNVFNIDRLKASPGNPSQFTSRPLPKATRVVLNDDGDEVHVIEALLDKKQFNRKLWYLVKWQSLPEHEATWEKETTIKKVSHFKQLVKKLNESKAAARRNQLNQDLEEEKETKSD